MLDEMQTRAELYDLIGLKDFEALDASRCESDISDKTGQLWPRILHALSTWRPGGDANSLNIRARSR
jgi:hypothetical protein